MTVEMKVKGLTLDPESNMFVVLLADSEGQHALPIGIGPFEANAILLKLKNTRLHRPQTHDLIRNILNAFSSEILRIEVVDIRENTYYALIYMMTEGKETAVDSRPSDAIALALAADAPIYVRERVLYGTNMRQIDKDMDDNQLKEFLESLDPEDFKYKS